MQAKTLQFAKQQCCVTSCKKMTSLLLGPNVSHKHLKIPIYMKLLLAGLFWFSYRPYFLANLNWEDFDPASACHHFLLLLEQCAVHQTTSPLKFCPKRGTATRWTLGLWVALCKSSEK